MAIEADNGQSERSTRERGDTDESKGERTRRLILEVAINHFALAGSRAASVPAIARAVGISTSAVYGHFESKEALFASAVDQDVAELVREALPEVLGGHFDGDFRGAITRLVTTLDGHPLARRVLQGLEAAGAERLAVLPAEVRLQQGIAAALAAGQLDGSVRADIDPQLHAAGLEAVVIALVMSLLQTEGAVDSMHAKGAIAVLEAAIRPTAGRDSANLVVR